MNELTDFKYAPSTQEVVFAEILARTQDPEHSYLEAGFEDLGSVRNSRKAFTLAKTPKIQERLEYHKALLTQQGNISVDKLLSHINVLAYSNVSDYHEPDGTFKMFKTLSREQKYAIKNYKVAANGRLTFVLLHDKNPYIEKLTKISNLFERHTQANAPKIVLNLNNVNQVVESHE